MSGENRITAVQGRTNAPELDAAGAYENEPAMQPHTQNLKPSAPATSTPQTGVRVGPDLPAVLASWEDEDRNRYYPLGIGSFLVHDGGNGSIRQVVNLTDSEVMELRRY